MASFVLQIQDLESSGKDWNFKISADWLASALRDSELRSDPSADPGRLHIQAQRSGIDVVVQSAIEARVVAECSRCLNNVPLDLSLSLTTLFTPASVGSASAIDEDDEADDLDREHYSGTEIVLDDLIREHIVLEAPMQPLCSESCPGIEIPEHVRPPEGVFGKEVRKESPFAALNKLKAKLAKNEE